MYSATPDLRLPSQPQGMTVPNLLFVDEGTCMRTTYPRLLPESGTAGDRTRDLSVASPTPSPSHHQATGILFMVCDYSIKAKMIVSADVQQPPLQRKSRRK